MISPKTSRASASSSTIRMRLRSDAERRKGLIAPTVARDHGGAARPIALLVETAGTGTTRMSHRSGRHSRLSRLGGVSVAETRPDLVAHLAQLVRCRLAELVRLLGQALPRLPAARRREHQRERT